MPPSSPVPPAPSRRDVALGAIGALAIAGRVAAQGPGFVIDWQSGPETPAIARSLADQIALVRALRIDPAIAAFFAAQTITVDREEDTSTRAGPRGIFFARRVQPVDNPVLLHELLHRYQLLRLPDGPRNPTVRRFYDEVRAAERFPADAYMLKNPFEFFAMTASTVLHGRTARPPFTRAQVAAKAPELYRWIVGEFGLQA